MTKGRLWVSLARRALKVTEAREGGGCWPSGHPEPGSLAGKPWRPDEGSRGVYPVAAVSPIVLDPSYKGQTFPKRGALRMTAARSRVLPTANHQPPTYSRPFRMPPKDGALTTINHQPSTLTYPRPLRMPTQGKSTYNHQPPTINHQPSAPFLILPNALFEPFFWPFGCRNARKSHSIAL